MPTLPPTMPTPTQSTPPPMHPILPLTQTLLPPLRKINILWDNYLMVRNILSLKVILLRRVLIAKLLLSNTWPTSVDFPNFPAVLVIPVTELNRSTDYNLSLLTTTQFLEHQNSWLTSAGFTSTERRIIHQFSEEWFNFSLGNSNKNCWWRARPMLCPSVKRLYYCKWWCSK